MAWSDPTGTIPEDNIHLEALALTNIPGNRQIYSWEEDFPYSFADGLSIMLVRLKGEQMPFVITESEGVWVDEVSTPDDHRFIITMIGPLSIHPYEVDNGNAP